MQGGAALRARPRLAQCEALAVTYSLEVNLERSSDQPPLTDSALTMQR